MFNSKDKIIVQLDANGIYTFILSDGLLVSLDKEYTSFSIKLGIEKLIQKVDFFIEKLSKQFNGIDNTRIRLYATGGFQELVQCDKEQMVISIFVNHGLYLNIVKPELVQFYKEKSVELYGEENIITGLVCQEFRSVVVCGSFKQHWKEITNIVNCMKKHNISVLSPWTTRIIPETLGTNFVRLEGQSPLKNERDSWTHRYVHMNKFRKSDAVIVCNPGGNVGVGTMFELGYMVAVYKRIIFTDPPRDLSLTFPCEVGLNFSD